MSEKTNAIRILGAQKIDFEMRSYEVSEEDLSAAHVAEFLEVEPERIFKTLVLVNNNNENLVAVLPSSSHLDLKKLAKASQSKKCEMIPMKELKGLTGYIRGGCSPVGMKKQFPTYIAEVGQLFDTIMVNAGKRGLMMILNPDDLLKITDGIYADIIEV